MARLIIKNVGPLQSIEIDLKKVTVLIGKQSCGKSTLAKIVSFCTWLDKTNSKTEKVMILAAAQMYQEIIILSKVSQGERLLP